MPEIEAPPAKQQQEPVDRAEPVSVETAAATVALNEISNKPSKDPLQEAVQKGDFAWLNGGMQKPGEVGTADYFLSYAREMHGDRPATPLSQGEIAARQMKGVFRTADMGIPNRNDHLLKQGTLADGRALYSYNDRLRRDNLKEAAVAQRNGVLETEKTFRGRKDGLETEKLFLGAQKQVIERQYDPTKNREGILSFKSVREGEKLTVAAEFRGRADGLTRENLTADKNGQLRVKEYADGRREEISTGKDGRAESKFFDAAGKPMTGDKFQEGQKALEAKISAEKAAQPARAPENGTEKLPGEGITLPPLKAGWGPYQALQQLQSEGKINLTPQEMKKEAERIRDREFAERGVTSFKQGDKIEFYSQKELKERGRGDAQPQQGQETSRERPIERQTNIEQRLADIKKALEPGTPNTPENADALRRQLSDLTPAEIQKLKAGFDKDNPNALGDAIKDRFSKMNGGLERHAHRWAEVEGHLNRTGQPGEDRAIKLRVDALEARWAGSDNNRSFAAIQANTRTTLLGLTEEQRQQLDTSLGKLYGQGGLSELYEKGPGKNLSYTGNSWYNGEDKFTKAVLDLASKKGVDARKPDEQANLLNMALQTRDLRNFREVASKEAMTEEGRKYFFDNGGLDKINENRPGHKNGTEKVFTEIERRELTDLAKSGEESPLTQFKKAIGVFSNTESSLTGAVKRISEDPKLRQLYLDGRELADPKTKREPKNEAERQALEFYTEVQKTFKSAYVFGSERKAQNFDAQIVAGPNGALSNGRLAELGASNWQHTSDLFKAIEGATPEQLNALFNGARLVDGRPQSAALDDGRRALGLGINRETNRARLDALLDKKVAYGIELGQIADRIKDTPRDTPVDAKTLQDLRDKVPAFKGMSPENLQKVVEGYRLDQAVREKTVDASKLTKQEQQQIVAYRNLSAEKNPQEALVKGFLEGRERQRTVDRILAAPDQSAGTRDRNLSEYLKGLKPEETRSLDIFRTIRNEAVQTNVKRDLKESLGDAKDQQSVIAALKGATPAERERIKSDPEYQKEIRGLVGNTINPMSRMATQMLLDSYANGKPLNKAESTVVNALEKVANLDVQGFERQKAVIDVLKDTLRQDKDGSVARELLASESQRKALELAIGGSRRFSTVVEPLLKTGMVPADQLQRIYGGGAESFKAGILEATPQGLKHLAGPEGQKDREALLKGLSPESRALADKILKQGEVKPEDTMRAVVLGLENQERAIDFLKTAPAKQRIETVRNYNSAFGSNLQEDLLKKVDEANWPTITLLATENQLTGEQSLIRSREALTNTSSTWLGGQALKYDSTIYRNLSDLALADRQYKGQIPPDVLDKRIKDLATSLKNFEGTKEELADLIVEGAITAAAIAATPFTGGASLSALMLTARLAALSAGGGLTGALLKAQLTGNYEHLAGDIVKFTALTGANLVGGEALTVLSGLGGRVASKTVEKAFAEPALAGALKGASPAVKEQLEKGLAELIQKGYTAGGVKDDAVRALVGGIQGLSKETQELLAKGLIDNLSRGVREVSAEGLKGTLLKAGRLGRTSALDGTAAYLGDVSGELARQLKDGHLDVSRALAGGVNSLFIGTGVRGSIESFRALKGLRRADGGLPAIREPEVPGAKIIDLSPSEYTEIFPGKPIADARGPRNVAETLPESTRVDADAPRRLASAERLRLQAPVADVPLPKLFDGIPPREVLKGSAPHELFVRVGGAEVKLLKKGVWFSPRKGFDANDLGDLKLHINVKDAADFEKIQAVLLPYLEKDPVLASKVKQYKLLNPDQAAAERSGRIGDGANKNKAFTIFPANDADLDLVRNRLDAILVQHGLGLEQPVESRLGDIVRSQSNRIGVARDIWNAGHVTVDGLHTPVAVLDNQFELAARKKLDLAAAGDGVKLSGEQLRQIEKGAGIRTGSLVYDDAGHLALRLENSIVDARGVYVAENQVAAKPGDLTNRAALYSLYKSVLGKEAVDVSRTAIPAAKNDLNGLIRAESIEPQGQRVLVDGKEAVVGSFNGGHQPIESPVVDVRHAKIGLDENGVFVVNESQHGTFFVRNVAGKEVITEIQSGFKVYVPADATVWLGHPQRGGTQVSLGAKLPAEQISPSPAPENKRYRQLIIDHGDRLEVRQIELPEVSDRKAQPGRAERQGEIRRTPRHEESPRRAEDFVVRASDEVTKPVIIEDKPIFAGARRTYAGIDFAKHGDLVHQGDSIAFGRNFLSQDIKNSKVSGKHAEVGIDQHGVYVQDLQSTNGTFIVRNNGGVREEVKLKPGRKHYLSEGEEIWLASPQEPAGHRLEARPAALREQLPNGIEVQTVDGRLSRLKFADGKVAELGDAGWKEYYPKGHPKAGQEADLALQRSYYSVNENGEIVRRGQTQDLIYRHDGTTDLRASGAVFRVEGSIDPKILARFERAYLAIPESLRNFVFAKGSIIRVGETLNDLDRSLKGVKPRGHNYTDASWSRLEGLHNPNRMEVLVAEQYRLNAKIHGPDNWVKTDRPEGVLRHEFGHAVDKALKRFADSPEFIAAYERDVAEHLSKMRRHEIERLDYFHQTPDGAAKLGSGSGRSEVVAEMLGVLLGGGSAPSLEKMFVRAFPNSRKLLEEKLKSFQ